MEPAYAAVSCALGKEEEAMFRSIRPQSMITCCIVLLACGTGTARADFYLVSNIDLDAHFGALGNNPINVAFDGTYAYVGGYSASATARDIGILKINVHNPADNTVLVGGTQSVNQFRYYGGLVLDGGILYALVDRPDGTAANTNVRAIDTATGQLVETFDGDIGNGNGIVKQPGALNIPALGGLAFDPGAGGDFGLSLLGFGSGRRVLLDLDGFTLYDTSDGMVVTDNDTLGCTVADKTAWRDHVYDANGNVYARRSNQVQKAVRSGANTTSTFVHLTDELNADGTPRVGCGDGKPVATRVGSTAVGQHLALIAGSAGSAQDLVIFNDRPDNSARSFAAAVKLVTTNGLLPSQPVQLLRANGSALTTSDVPDGIGLYDFYWEGETDTLLIVDFTSRNLLVFAPQISCGTPAQDADNDGDIDMADFELLAACLNGPGTAWAAAPNQAACVCLDADDDGDVDLIDFAGLQAAFGG
jgi:hypothetical protein